MTKTLQDVSREVNDPGLTLLNKEVREGKSGGRSELKNYLPILMSLTGFFMRQLDPLGGVLKLGCQNEKY